MPTWAPVVGHVELTDEAAPAPRRVRRWLHALAVALMGACLVAVVSAGRPDESTSMRSDQPTATAVARRRPSDSTPSTGPVPAATVVPAAAPPDSISGGAPVPTVPPFAGRDRRDDHDAARRPRHRLAAAR